MKENKISGVDTLRFLAFSTVFIFHTVPSFRYGFLGIDLFFVISSFLLTYLALKEIKSTGSFSQTNFFIRRALRIYPLYYAVILFCFLAIPVLQKTHDSVQNKWLYIFFLSNYDKSNNPFPLKLLWSIAVEEQFYLIFIIISPLFKTYIKHVIAGLLLISVITTIIFTHYHIGIYSSITTYLFDFGTGMFLGNLYFQKKRIKNIHAFYGTILSLGLFYFLSLDDYADNFLNIPASIIFALIISVTINFFNIAFIKESIVIRITEYWGKYTYGLYVLSGLTITLGIGLFRDWPIIFSAIFKFVILLPLAWLSYNWFEKKFLNIKTKFR